MFSNWCKTEMVRHPAERIGTTEGADWQTSAGTYSGSIAGGMITVVAGVWGAMSESEEELHF